MASRNSSAPGELSYERVLDRVAGAVQSVLGIGRVPDQIPVLAGADPQLFGLAVATVDGEVHGVGQWRRRFSIQSISKVFTLASRSDAKRINAVMLTCGTYDAAGAYRVDLPAKSGVAGGILAIVPGRCSLCVWSGDSMAVAP